MEGSPFPTFRDASDSALAFLQKKYPMGLWMVTRTVGNDWIVLRARDRRYDVADGDLFVWSDSFCSRMVQGHAPHIAPDSNAIPAYVEAPIGKQIPISSYIGFPLEADGELFGTLCAIDSVTKPEDLTEAEELIGLLARMLSTILEADMRTNRLSAMAQRLADVADRDVLTNLLNRRGWDRIVTQAEYNRTTYGHKHCVVIIDLDGLKSINDTYGHTAGDALLRRVSAVVSEVTGKPDVVARLGGDEFAVLLDEPASLNAEAYVRRLKWSLEQAGVSAAIGSAMSAPTTSLEQATHEADLHMYEEKRRVS